MTQRHEDHIPSVKKLDYGEQDENGIDLSQIRENLRKTPTERVRRADRARKEVLRLMEYGRRHREKRS